MAEEQTARKAPRPLEPSSFIGERRPVVRHEPCKLEICAACGSHLVHPLEWEKAKNGFWHVTLRCPECERLGGGIFDQATLDRYDEALDEAASELLEDLVALARANFADEAERFIAALSEDHILPEDF